MSSTHTSPRAQECLALIREQPGITRPELARIMGCADRTVGQYLYLLSAAQQITKTTRCGITGAWGWEVPGADMRPALLGGRVSSVWELGARL